MKTTRHAAAEISRAFGELHDLPPEERAARSRALVDEAKAVCAATGDEAIVEALARYSYAELGQLIGVSVSAINKAVTRHRARMRAAEDDQ